MSQQMNESTAKAIMGKSFVGSQELRAVARLGLLLPEPLPEIPFDQETLEQKKQDYYLILGLSRFADGSSVTIRGLRSIYGRDPGVMEPCFYNQDWYDREAFAQRPMAEGWYLIRKTVYEDSRAVQPQQLEQRYSFPWAITCAYSFFVVWETTGEKLWYHDFVWCRDTDHNGDRIYVGRYHDADSINKNGFNIHRHLALRTCYACID